MPYKTKEAKLANAKRYREANRETVNARVREWKTKLKADPMQYKEYLKDRNLKTHYGISLENVDALIQQQLNCCALCKEPFSDASRKDPVVDHDHTTGLIRGILHRGCNMALGQFGDSAVGLQNALKYLSPEQPLIDEHY